MVKINDSHPNSLPLGSLHPKNINLTGNATSTSILVSPNTHRTWKPQTLIQKLYLRKDSPSADLIFGSVAGVLGKFVEFPFDTVKVRLQTQPITATQTSLPFTGALDCFFKTLRSEGFRGLYKGLATPLVGSIVENSILFTGYSFAQRRLREASGMQTDEKLSVAQLCLAGFLSGSMVSVLLTPVELVKCKLQVQDVDSLYNQQLKQQSLKKYAGPWSVIQHTLRNKGPLGLYRGFVGTLLRESVGGAAWFGAYEVVVDQFLKRESRIRGYTLDKEHLPAWQLMCAGAVAGMSFNAALFPADVIKARQQTEDLIHTSKSQVGKSFTRVAKELYAGEGLRGFYRGFTITIMRSAPTSAVIFVTYEMLNRNLTYEM